MLAFFSLTMILVWSCFSERNDKFSLGPWATEGEYYLLNTIYFIFKNKPRFKLYNIWLSNTSHYHLYHLLLVKSISFT